MVDGVGERLFYGGVGIIIKSSSFSDARFFNDLFDDDNVLNVQKRVAQLLL